MSTPSSRAFLEMRIPRSSNYAQTSAFWLLVAVSTDEKAEIGAELEDPGIGVLSISPLAALAGRPIH